MSSATVPSRRTGLSYASEDEVIADVARLRKGCAKAGNWTLAQTCWHLATAVRSRMSPGPHPANTPEQDARRAQLQQVLASGALPSGIPAPESMTPPTECDDSAIDKFVTVLTQFKSFTGDIAPHRLFGKLPDADIRRLNLIHCAHHLSYLLPTSPTPRQLKFNTIDEAISEIERLGRGYERTGQWSLEQACWHCRFPLQFAIDNPAASESEPTPEQLEKQKWFAGMVADAQRTRKRIEAAPNMQPPPECPTDEPQRLSDALRKLDTWDKPRFMMGPMGPMPIHEARAFHLFHIGHHLGYLVPIGSGQAGGGA